MWVPDTCRLWPSINSAVDPGRKKTKGTFLGESGWENRIWYLLLERRRCHKGRSSHSKRTAARNRTAILSVTHHSECSLTNCSRQCFNCCRLSKKEKKWFQFHFWFVFISLKSGDERCHINFSGQFSARTNNEGLIKIESTQNHAYLLQTKESIRKKTGSVEENDFLAPNVYEQVKRGKRSILHMMLSPYIMRFNFPLPRHSG